MNNNRTAANTGETVLTPANVSLNNFGKLGQLNVDGVVFAQPLFEPASVTGTVDLVIICTMHNTVYAFDAGTLAQVWMTSLGPSLSTYAPSVNPADLHNSETGVLSTPVIDEAARKIYVVGTSGQGINSNFVLFQLSLTSGAILNQITITAQYPGTGDTVYAGPAKGHVCGPLGDQICPADPTAGGMLQFLPYMEMSREALTLANGNVYIGFCGYGDQHPWHGWMVAYSTTTLAQVGVFCFSPNSWGSAPWQAGGGAVVDSSGNLYVVTGNGAYNIANGDYSESVVKLSPTLAVLDYFSPANATELDGGDTDMGSNRPILAAPNVLAVGGKDQRLWNLNPADLGHQQGAGGTAPRQIWANSGTDPNGLFNGFAFINNRLYAANAGGKIRSYVLSGSAFVISPGTVSTAAYPAFGAQLWATSNGVSNTLLWAITPDASLVTAHTGTLRVFDGITLAELYHSAPVGTATKFLSPTVVNGRAYVGTSDGFVAVFGLLTAPARTQISGSVAASGTTGAR